MKKRTVITTEKREVWVVRKSPPEPPEEQSTDVSNAIEVALPDLQESDDHDNKEE
jgi:hypothetical protein